MDRGDNTVLATVVTGTIELQAAVVFRDRLEFSF